MLKVRLRVVLLKILILVQIIIVIGTPAAGICMASGRTEQNGGGGAANQTASISQAGVSSRAVQVKQDETALTKLMKRFNMSYVYFGDSGRYTELVDNAKGSLNDISPSYFDLEDDGSLKITAAMEEEFIADMHLRGIKVTPFLSNHWDREKGITALNNREQLTEQIKAVVDEYNLDGVNVDIENMTHNEAADYVDLVRLLREKLPEGKSVSVAVAVNPYGIAEGWQASYDYAALAQYCDYLMLMAYDEHYQGYVNNPGSAAGPVAGFRFVEDSIKAALKLVPADKLVLGVPFYGRLWKRGASYGGYGISNYMVEELIREYKGTVIYDYSKKSPRAVITIGAADKKPVVFGKKLEAGTYDIWFENEASIKRKLELVEKYDLKGTGSWSLGQETTNTWDYYSMWLNGIYFGDIQSHWAKSSILSMLDRGWMKGMSTVVWAPDAPMTRAQAAALLVRVLNIDKSGPDTDEPVFKDTQGHWACTEIEAAFHYGLVEGVGGGKFAPDAVLTREQMAVMLYRVMKPGEQLMKSGRQTQKMYSDVTEESSSWSFDAIMTMTESGLFEGFPDGTFRPKDAMSRGQIAALTERSWRYLQEGFRTEMYK